MAGDVRDRMIDGAIRLLAQQGLQATSFAEVLQLTGAPRGSVYHHFPGGKDQLVSAAVDRAGAHALQTLDGKQGDSAEELTTVFLGLWRELLVLPLSPSGWPSRGKLRLGAFACLGRYLTVLRWTMPDAALV
jgi:TetR/AcrR family transcriptional regulator, lmrAB and yxaGH operons repressor